MSGNPGQHTDDIIFDDHSHVCDIGRFIIDSYAVFTAFIHPNPKARHNHYAVVSISLVFYIYRKKVVVRR